MNLLFGAGIDFHHTAPLVLSLQFQVKGRQTSANTQRTMYMTMVKIDVNVVSGSIKYLVADFNSAHS